MDTSVMGISSEDDSRAREVTDNTVRYPSLVVDTNEHLRDVSRHPERKNLTFSIVRECGGRLIYFLEYSSFRFFYIPPLRL